MPTGTTARAGTSACSRTQYSWKWIARCPDGSAGVVDHDVRLDPVVAHRQQPDPGLPALGTAPSVTAESG